MVTDISLSPQQINELRFNLKGHSAMEAYVKRCKERNICSRTTARDAVTSDKYDAENPLHRLAVDQAVKMLKDEYQTTFPWAEIETAAA